MRNTLLFYVLAWIAELNDVHKIRIYCSHIAGASDTFDSELLICKLEPFGFSEKLVNVIRKLLRQRQGFVIVTEKNHHRCLCRILSFRRRSGAPALECFFGDCIWAISSCRFEVVIYADN